MIEAGSPNTLVRRGMTRDSIPAGTEVVVFGYRHRNGSNAANGRDVTLPDGRRLFITSPGTGAPGGSRSNGAGSRHRIPAPRPPSAPRGRTNTHPARGYKSGDG